MSDASIVGALGVVFAIIALVCAWLSHAGDRVDDLTDEHADWLGADSSFHGWDR